MARPSPSVSEPVLLGLRMCSTQVLGVLGRCLAGRARQASEGADGRCVSSPADYWTDLPSVPTPTGTPEMPAQHGPVPPTDPLQSERPVGGGMVKGQVSGGAHCRCSSPQTQASVTALLSCPAHFAP